MLCSGELLCDGAELPAALSSASTRSEGSPTTLERAVLPAPPDEVDMALCRLWCAVAVSGASELERWRCCCSWARESCGASGGSSGDGCGGAPWLPSGASGNREATCGGAAGAWEAEHAATLSVLAGCAELPPSPVPIAAMAPLVGGVPDAA